MITETALPGEAAHEPQLRHCATVLLWLDLEPAKADGLAQVSQDQNLQQRCQEWLNSENDRKDAALKCKIADVFLHIPFLTFPWQPCDLSDQHLLHRGPRHMLSHCILRGVSKPDRDKRLPIT